MRGTPAASIRQPDILELEAYLERRHARGTQNYRIDAGDAAQSKTSGPIFLIQHIPHVACYVEPGSSDVVPLDPGVQEGIAADFGVGIQGSEPIGGNVDARGEVRRVKVTLRVDVLAHHQCP